MRAHLAIVAVSVIVLLCDVVHAADPVVLDVWPDKAPDLPAQVEAETWDANKPGATPFKRVTNVSKPSLTIHRPPADKDTGVCVLVCPGGGYKFLMMDYEGEDVAKWLTTIGVTGIVLKYRVPAPAGTPRYLPALQDAQRALSLIRSKANQWNLNPDKIGMLGFSAGGHLTAAASVNFDKRTYKPVDSSDQASCRPDFAVLIYPGGILDKETGQMSAEIKPTEKTPPTFMAMAHDDRVNSENAILYYLALKKANVNTEMHIYASGGHGFGMRPSTRPSATWPARLAEWMADRGIVKPQQTP